MKYLSDAELAEANFYISRAAEIALKSCCHRARCGSVVVSDGEIIGEGWNSPPGDEGIEKCFKDELPEDFISDKTCCVHAEDRAIRDALVRNPGKIKDSRIYFVRLSEDDTIARSGAPYCTWCSKTALDVGVLEFVLFREKGVCAYDTAEYNKLSYLFRK